MNTVPLNIVTDGEHASHLDHAMTAYQRRYAIATIREGNATILVGEAGPAFYIASVTIPSDLGKVACALRGPAVGDAPIADVATFRGTRKDRPNDSRLTNAPPAASDTITAIVIGGNLATMYGGPLAPREPNDPDIPENELEESRKFWSVHALSAGEFDIDIPKADWRPALN